MQDMQRTVLWDNDGVLVNTEELFFEANRRFFQRHGVHVSEEVYFEHFLAKSSGLWHILRERGASDSDIDEGRRERDALYAQLLQDAPNLVVNGIVPVLESLSQTTRMAVVTSSRRSHFDQIHAKTGLSHYFCHVVAAGDYQMEKPSPEPYQVAMKRLGTEPGACIAVEDSPRGLHAALAAGLRCVVLRSALAKRSSFPGAHAVVSSPQELHAVLDRWLESPGGGFQANLLSDGLA
jgi:HAD superfamily hydrolase (TIGR01509 family)